jgi:hypothetical protein
MKHLPLLGFLLSVSAVFAAPPPYFVANEGQWDGTFAFKAQVGNVTYFVTSAGMTIDLREYEQLSMSKDPLDRFDVDRKPQALSVRGHVLKLNFVNANPTPQILGEDKLSSYSNYFFGRDSCQWRSRVPHYQKVVLKDVWPGIDVELVARKKGVETVYHVAPIADPSQIEIEVEGLAAPLAEDANGRLLFATSLGALTEQAPYAYQREGRIQRSVDVHYRALSASRYSVTLSGYDPQKELQIDPLLYGTLLGGEGPDYLLDMAVTPEGSLYVCGKTSGNSGFPTSPGAYQEQVADYSVGFITAFSSAGDSLQFSTYFGSPVQNPATYSGLLAIGVATDGTVWVGGHTNNPDWPLTPDALDTTVNDPYADACLAHFSAAGSELLYSTLIGGQFADGIWDLGVAGDGRVCAIGQASTGFPVTPDALYSEPASAYYCGFFLVFDPSALALQYSTLLTASNEIMPLRVLLTEPGIFWITGNTRAPDFPVTPNAAQSQIGGPDGVDDGFLLRFNLEQNQITYGSFLGGTERDELHGAHVIQNGNVVVSGFTLSSDFPVTPGAFDTSFGAPIDGFITIIDVDGGIQASTFLGDTGGDYHEVVKAVWFDATDVVAVGTAQGPTFPTTPGAFDTIFNDDDLPNDNYQDLFVSRLSGDLSQLDYSTFIGGWHTDYCLTAWIENRDTVWIGGTSGSPDFPLTPNAFQTQQAGNGDAFLCRFSIGDTAVSAQDPFILPPSSFILSVYPNPFNPSTTISFSLPHELRVKVAVYDMLGRLVENLSDRSYAAGRHSIHLESGGWPSGLYFARLSAGDFHTTQKLILLR